jgi:hypothetical protein
VASRCRQLTQGEVLSRAVQARGGRRERRVLGAARVNRVLADAALANDVKRYREDWYETLRLIGRLGSPGRGAAVSRSARSSEHTGPAARCARMAAGWTPPGPRRSVAVTLTTGRSTGCSRIAAAAARLRTGAAAAAWR